MLSLNNQESRMKKKCQKSGNDQKSQTQIVKVSHIFRDNLKASLQHILIENEIA